MDRKSHALHLFILLTAALGAGAFFSYALTKRLFGIALERNGAKKIENIPIVREMVSGILPQKEFLCALRKGEKQLRSLPTQKIEIKGADGIPLVGHWYPAKNPARTIIAMHGWRSSWARDFGLIASFWHKAGCNVLFAEQRGQGESGGEHMSFGLIERQDCLCWIQWVNQRMGKFPLYLAGISMGAATVLMAADLGLPCNVKGIIADCGFTSPHAIWKHVSEKNLHLSYRLRGQLADHFCKKTLQVGANDFSTLDALCQSTIPILLIHGKEDHFVPVEMTYENYKACAGPKRMLIIPHADHGMSYYSAPDAYQKELLNFFATFDHYKTY
ncbi:MAG: alpha/beta hydrolase [Clostridia bacterium]|nr:alpha/beta hydrolase [Clostridia bacterium]